MWGLHLVANCYTQFSKQIRPYRNSKNDTLDVNSIDNYPHTVNLLSPHDALKHHFTSLKTDLIFLEPRILEQKFP